VLALESLRAAAAALHRRTSSLGESLGLYQPWERVLGTAEAARRAVRGRAATAGGSAAELRQSHAVSPIVALASYAATFAIDSESAIRTARHCLIDALARGFEALDDPERAALIGPLVPGALMPGGARVPGTSLELDPAQAAFCTGVMLCRAAGSEHWLALECGHAADSLGAILSIADYQARKATMEGQSPPKVRDLLSAAVKALEIQGVLALEGGHHHSQTAAIRLARVAANAVVTAQLGGKVGEIAEALSYSCIDGGTATGVDEERAMERGEWATADAISRAVRHACQVMAAARPSAATSLHPRTLELA